MLSTLATSLLTSFGDELQDLTLPRREARDGIGRGGGVHPPPPPPPVSSVRFSRFNSRGATRGVTYVRPRQRLADGGQQFAPAPNVSARTRSPPRPGAGGVRHVRVHREEMTFSRIAPTA
jgi:hypothetical protein